MPLAPTGTREANYRAMLDARITRIEQRIQRLPSRFATPTGKPSNAVVDFGLVQVSHGFDVGTIVFWDSDLEAYRLAKADDAETCVYDGVVSKVTDANTFDLTYSGVIEDVDADTYDDGTIYYLSAVTAGVSAEDPPTYTFYQVPVYHAFLDNDGTTLNLLVYPGRALGSSHLAIVAGDASNGGGTGRIYSTATIYWDLTALGVMSVNSGTNVNSMTATQSNIDDGTSLSTLTSTSLTVGATPASPTSKAVLNNTGLTITASSATVAAWSATLFTMTLSATNSLSLAASDITDTSQAVKFRKVSICDPASGLVKNTWLACSAPF
jgi:hypothetical protein